jgi:Predicted membrane protein
MKQLAILSTMLLFALVSLQVSAQEDVKKEIKQTKKEIKATKKELKGNKKEPKTELKTERKELRELRGEIVSEQSKTQFYADFGNVPNVQWVRTKYFDEATFEKDGKQMKAYYDDQFTLVGTTTDKTFDDLPAPAKKEIKKKYKDYTVQRVIFFDDNEANDTDMLLYGQQFEDADHYFVELTKNGKTLVLMATPEGEVSWFKEL